MKLFGELVGQSSGTAIVVGGGPTALEDLLELKLAGVHPSVVLSANEHGHRQDLFAITHSVCCDGRHGEKRVSMEVLLREFGPQPILTPAHFGTYRLAEWSLAGNTGIAAIAVACFMGCAPVIPVGLDFYRMSSPSTYFHDPNAKSNSMKKNPRNFLSQIESLVKWVGTTAPIRPMRGLLLETFPKWTPDELVAAQQPPRARYFRGLPTLIVQARAYPPVSWKVMQIEPGRLFPMAPNEARGMLSNHSV